MIRDGTIQTREKLISKLPVTGELLRGSLLDRTVRHTKDCPKCARGEGHRVFVLTVTYAGGRTQQFSVRRERAAEVRSTTTPLCGCAGGCASSTKPGDARAGPILSRTFTGISSSYACAGLGTTCRG